MPVATQEERKEMNADYEDMLDNRERDVLLKDRGTYEDRIKYLEIELRRVEEQQDEFVDHIKTTMTRMGADIERKRLQEVFRTKLKFQKLLDRIDLIKSFIEEKLAPGELQQFDRHRRNNRGFLRDENHTQYTTDPSALVDDAFSPSTDGGRGGKRRTRKKKTRKSKKKSRRKYK